ncbi:hepatic sodium/bile acid cotransporter-like [Argiope bruennichi]|uniref:hepatic sodium/bile acid cotransporter-like n=1 Tax=Argiope bruennichi TaxID=94029 RepID=UPI0024956BC3|nr:hepatic sodium/bile acid cotransporter-like [Argiope bruennichi]
MAWKLVICCILYASFANAAVGTNIHSLDLIPKVDFFPTELLGIEEEQERDILFEINWTNATNETSTESSQPFPKDYFVTVASSDSGILEIVNSSYSNCININDKPHNFTIVVRGVFLGYTNVKVSLKAATKGCGVEDNDELTSMEEARSRDFEVLVTVIRPPSILVNSVTVIFAILVAFNFINMGVQLDMESIMQVLKKPVGPAIGFACQFLFMPLASFGISHLLFDDNSLRLGLFTLGCSPGGSMSNFWTLLFDGDVNLSVTMTFISTVAALGMMPLWIFTLGASLFREKEASIPYMNMVGSLLGLTFPIIIGLLIKKYSPKLTRISLKIIKPFTIIIVLFGITFASYVNRFVYYLFTWQVVVAGLSIAWGGYCFGALVSWIFRLDRAQIIAISIETAFQNPAVAFVLLLLTLPQPGADLASVPIVAQLMLTGIPMWVVLLGIKIYKKINRYNERGSTGQIAKPQIDTVQNTYLAVETNPPEEKVYYESRANKVGIERYSIQS